MNPTDPTSDREPRAEFAGLLARHHTALLGHVLALVPRWSDAEDIVQETSAVLWRKFEEFQPGTNFFAWACQIARFHVMNHVRKRVRDKHVFTPELIETMSREGEAEVDELEAERKALHGCLGKLGDNDRSLLGKCYAGEATVKMAAEALGCTPNAVYKTLNRIRQALLRCVRKTLALEGV